MSPGRMDGVMWIDLGLHALFVIVVVVVLLRS
jgi:hypothetical protein